ncbi:MAG TPA: hypothetical protein EYN66_24540 [Myxococcales bacterium]|nr:hypothetical protein [Myxococcales bacterium]
MNTDQYAGWFVVDMRLLVFVLFISAFTSLGIVALVLRGRRWYEYLVAFISLFVVVLIVVIMTFNQIADYPVLLIEEVFPFP